MLTLLAGCDAPAPGNGAAGPPPTRAVARTVLETEESARFRMAARQLFGALEAPACGTPGSDSRDAQLAPERAATAAFEARLGTTGAAFQLAVARADARYRLDCRSDGRRRVEMVRAQVAGALAELWKLLPRLDQVPVQEPIPARAVAYRDLVRRLVFTVQPQCALARNTADSWILAPALEAVRQYQARLPGPVHRHHYAIAKSDVDLAQSMTMVECATPSDAPADRLRGDLLADVRRQIAALEAIRL